MKTVLYIGDFTHDYKSVPREGYLTVQQYAYACMRSRNDAGFPYGPVLTTILDFTIRLQLPEDSKVFHKRMHDNNPYPYSFVFDPEFMTTDKKNLKEFASAMIVAGHIIDVEETLDAKPDTKGTSKQVEVHLKLLVSEIIYVGKTQQKKLVLRQDSKGQKVFGTSGDTGGGGGQSGDDTSPSKKEETVVSFSKYALYINSPAPAEGIDGGITHSVSQTLKNADGKSVNVLLNSLSYHKKISQPNEITAILSVTWTGDTPPSYQLLTDLLMNKRAELKVLDETAKLDHIIAKNYFVYQMKPCFKTAGNSSSIDVELHMFSLDKLATLDKFSKAHTAQKLGKDMFTPELQSFNVGGMALQGFTENMQFLGLTDDEMRIPYAVQYDESFYEFLQRITQRYGEFLFFEGGKLRIGLKPSETNYYTDSKKTEVKDWASSTDLKMRYYESILPNTIEVEEEYFPYLNRKDNDSAIYVTGDVKDANGNITEHHYYNPDMISSDEYLSEVEKDGYASMKAKYKIYEKLIVEEVFAALNGTSLAGILSNLAVSEAMRLAKNVVQIENDNDFFNSINITPYAERTDQKDGDKLKQFATYSGNTAFSTVIADKVVNFTSVFYSMIRKMEKDVAHKAVFLEFGNHTQPFALGDKIKVDGIDYVIIEIEGMAEKAQDVYNDTQKVVAIPYYGTNILVPPALPIPLIREAKPQRAFITDGAFEPEKIGRVRFRYPWQGSDEEASPWVRVALPMTTNGGGVNFRPETGDEAMIDYEAGNIDRPFVTGYMTSPYIKQTWGASVLPDRGMMSKNGHSVTFSDGIDGVNFFGGWVPVLGTIKNFVPIAKWPDKLEEMDNQKMIDLVGSTTITDRYGLYKISASSDGRNITLKSPLGDIAVNAFTGIKIDAPNGDISINGKNVSIKAANNLTMQSGGNLKNRFVDKNFLEDLGMDLLNGVSKVVEKALDLTLIRTFLEVFMRPIDGTLKIKSSTFVMLEAGPGKVEVPRGSYRKAPKDYLNDEEFANQGTTFPKIKNTLGVISSSVDAAVEGFKNDCDALCNAVVNFNTWCTIEDPQKHIITFNEILTKAKSHRKADSMQLAIEDGDLDANAPELTAPPEVAAEQQEQPKRENFPEDELGNLAYEMALQNWNDAHAQHEANVAARAAAVQHIEQVKVQVKQKATDLLRAINNLYLSTGRFRSAQIVKPENVGPDQMYADPIIEVLNTQDFVDFKLTIAKAFTSEFNEDLTDYVIFTGWGKEKKILKRKMAYKMMKLDEVKQVFKVKDLTEPDYANDKSWKSFVDNVFTDNSTGTKVKNWFYEHYGKNFVEMAEVFTKNKLWGPDVKGRILMSDNPAKTMYFSRNSMFEANNVEAINDRYDVEIKRILGDVK